MSLRKLRLIVSPDAHRDLRDILMFTDRVWGSHRRRQYRVALYEAMQRLRIFPQIGRQRDDLAPGLRALPVEMHVTIIRVLHGHADAPYLLTPPAAEPME